MGRPRQPVELLQAKGKKHLTKAEIELRKQTQIEGETDNIEPPDYLTKKQKDRFFELANELIKIEIMKNTDCDCLARYIIAEGLYIKFTKMLSKSNDDVFEIRELSNLQDRYFRQCRNAANDLGLSITSRCKLVVPKTPEEKPENKFAKFDVG